MYFRALEDMLSTRYYIMKLLPSESRSQIFVPVIQTLDQLLVMGVVHGEDDYKRVLALLDPQLFTAKDNRSEFIGQLRVCALCVCVCVCVRERVYVYVCVCVCV